VDYTDADLTKIYEELPEQGMFDDIRCFIEIGRAEILAKFDVDKDFNPVKERDAAYDLGKRDGKAEWLDLERINAIRNSIVGTQTVNWSAHVYPLVAALNEAGFEGQGYEEARKEAETLIEQRDELMALLVGVLEVAKENGADIRYGICAKAAEAVQG
jgi:hypothetical protein